MYCAYKIKITDYNTYQCKYNEIKIKDQKIFERFLRERTGEHVRILANRSSYGKVKQRRSPGSKLVVPGHGSSAP